MIMKSMLKSIIIAGVAMSLIVVAGFHAVHAAKPAELRVIGLNTRTKAGSVYPEEGAFVIKEIEKQHNIRLTPVEIPWNDAQQIALMIAAGETADTALIGQNVINVYLKEDALRLITLEEWKQYAPTWYAMFDDPAYNLLPVYEEGKGMYALPHVGFTSEGKYYSEAPPMQAVRVDWLQKLGLNQPANLEEYTTMLQAFTEQDPDGNGEKDTWGMSIQGKKGINEQLQFLYWAMGGKAVLGQPEIVGGVFTMSVLTDAYKEMLKYVADMYAKGYVYMDINIDRNGTFLLVENSTIGVHGTTFTWLMPKYRPTAYYANLLKKEPDAKLEILTPFGSIYSAPRIWAYWGIGSQVSQEQFEASMKLLETQLTDDTFADLIWRGKEGVHFTVNEETGAAVYTDAYKDITEQGKAGLKWMILNIRGESQSLKSYGTAMEEVVFEYLSRLTQEPAPLPQFVQTDAQLEYDAALTSHVESYSLRAMTGGVNVDETWEQYVKDYMGIGGKEVIAEMQAVYEEMK